MEAALQVVEEVGAAVTEKEVEAVEVMEIMEEVVVGAVKEAKVGVEEENQEAMVENPLVVGATRSNCLKLVLKFCQSPGVNPFRKNHL